MWQEKRKQAEDYFKNRWKGVSKEDVSDFGAYCIELWLSGKGLKSQYKYLAIDFLRKHYKRTKSRGSSDLLLNAGRIPLREDVGKPSLDLKRFEDSINLIKIKNDPIHRAVLVLTYEWEFTLKEIGNVLGFTEQRVSQLILIALSKEKNNRKTKSNENKWEIIIDTGLDEKAQAILRRIQAQKNAE